MPPGTTGHSESGAMRNAPNRELRRIREQERHETREQFAAAMARIARETGSPVIPDAKYVARLETGAIRYPGPAYRFILTELCGRPFGALGFDPPPGLSVPERADADTDSVKGGNAVPPAAGRLNMTLRNAVLSSGLELPQIARRVGVDPKSVQRWITRGVVPHPRHRWKTCEILGADESDLWPDAVYERERQKTRAGFAAREMGKPGNDGPVSGDEQRVRHDSGLLDLADDMNRRELLRILSMTGTLLAIGQVRDSIDWERLDYFADRGGKLDSQAVEEYASLNTHLWRVFVLSRTKRVVFPLVRDQLDTLTSSFGRVTGPMMYRRLCELTASLFQLAGEILFDGNQYTDAAQCYTLAATASKEATMPDLWACALTRHAFIGVFERRFDKSAPMLELAAALARRGDTALATRHWVAIVQAQTFAGLGDLEACQRSLDIAAQVNSLSKESQNGGWLRFDGSRLAEERGACYVQLQRPDLAESALTDALNLNLSVRRRGTVLTDLAALGAQRLDPDRIISYGNAALDLLSQTGSGVIARKLTGLQPRLTPLLGDSRVRDLNNRILTLTGNPAAR